VRTKKRPCSYSRMRKPPAPPGLSAVKRETEAAGVALVRPSALHSVGTLPLPDHVYQRFASHIPPHLLADQAVDTALALLTVAGKMRCEKHSGKVP